MTMSDGHPVHDLEDSLYFLRSFEALISTTIWRPTDQTLEWFSCPCQESEGRSSL